MPYEISELTTKAQNTRQQILDTALALFIEKGYEATTMREVAKACECSLGLTYRYFSSKEQLLLEFYWQMAAEAGAQIERLPPGTIADRFFALMAIRLEQTLHYRELFRVIFGVAMNPNSGVNIFSNSAAGMRADVAKQFAELVAQSTNPPSKAQSEDVATLLYCFHFGVILFWLYDRSPNQRITVNLLAFIRDLLQIGRRFLGLPFVNHELARAADIAQALLNSQ